MRNNDQKVIAIIPARFDSSRFPGKPLAIIEGKSMIERVYNNVRSCSSIDEVIVATDDDRIFNEVIRFGGKVKLTSKDHKNGTERIAELAKEYDEDCIIVNVQGDEPLINDIVLEEILKIFDDPSVKIATLVNLADNLEDLSNPNRVKVILNNKNIALYFSRKDLKCDEDHYYIHIGLYAFKNKTLQTLVKLNQGKLEKIEKLEQLRWLENGYNIHVAISDYKSISVDVKDDIDQVIDQLKKSES